VIWPVISRAISHERDGITIEHGIHAGSLPGPLRDPFDRMLIAQAQMEELVIISNELIFDNYGVQRLW
jgi:PIN domain nuclease of toxin-antitoxin system